MFLLLYFLLRSDRNKFSFCFSLPPFFDGPFFRRLDALFSFLHIRNAKPRKKSGSGETLESFFFFFQKKTKVEEKKRRKKLRSFQTIEFAAEAMRGHRSAHSLATGPVIADPFISPLGLTITPALSSK